MPRSLECLREFEWLAISFKPGISYLFTEQICSQPSLLKKITELFVVMFKGCA